MNITIKNTTGSTVTIGGKLGKVAAYQTKTLKVSGYELEASSASLTKLVTAGALTVVTSADDNLDNNLELATVGMLGG